MKDFFSYEDFLMNDKWEVTIQPWNGSHILFAENIYQHPQRVWEYLSQIPIFSLKPPGKDRLNGRDFVDGQHHCDFRFDPSRSVLFNHIIKFYGLKPNETFGTNPVCVFNQFKLLEDCPGKPYFWSPHVDNTVNVLFYLNPDENYTPGTSLYSATPKGKEVLDSDTEHVIPWKDSSWFEERLCILSRFNTMVAFPGQWPHGQTIIDNRYKEKTRFTEVTFF
tara:strand:- start:145 stop:807 length:663 start_codon:yes stop_codon:yes gene_type:complete